HADEDKMKKEKVTARNEADALIYRAEKMIKDSGAGMDPESIHQVEGLVSDLKQALKQDDLARMKKLTQDLTQALHALSQAMYNKTDASGSAGQTGGQGGAKPADDDIVDAEFSEVA
ncbi:MAG: Hsp70 family protein, partial [Desulfobacula sp.]